MNYIEDTSLLSKTNDRLFGAGYSFQNEVVQSAIEDFPVREHPIAVKRGGNHKKLHSMGDSKWYFNFRVLGSSTQLSLFKTYKNSRTIHQRYQEILQQSKYQISKVLSY